MMKGRKMKMAKGEMGKERRGSAGKLGKSYTEREKGR